LLTVELGAKGFALGLVAEVRFHLDVGNGGVVGDFFDHVAGMEAEVDAANVAGSGVQGTEDQFGALEFDGAAEQGVDDLDEGGLDGLLVLEEGGVVDAGGGRAFDSAEHALMEVAELLSAKSGGATTNTADLDVSAIFEVWHRGPLDNFFVVAG
jgi:hypothetical protein